MSKCNCTDELVVGGGRLEGEEGSRIDGLGVFGYSSRILWKILWNIYIYFLTVDQSPAQAATIKTLHDYVVQSSYPTIRDAIVVPV